MNFEEINQTIHDIKSDTIVKVEFDEKGQVIKKMELLKVVGMNKTSLKLSDGKTVSKGSLFPYHRKQYRKEIEYFYLVDMTVNI